MFPVKFKISLMSLNVRGIQDKVKRKAMFLFCKSNGSQCVFLQETHSTVSDSSFWSSQWGDKVLLSHGSSHSAGTAILFNNCPGKIISAKYDPNGHWLAVVLDIEHFFFILVNVYGYNNSKLNQNLLQEISSVISDLKRSYPTENIVVGGDFNVVPDETYDRYPPKSTSSLLNPLVSKFCSNLKIIDVWRYLHPSLRQFSWFRPNAASKSRIDYWLVSDNLLLFAKDCTMSAAPLTDHCSISLIIQTDHTSSKTKGYWKFNSDLINNEKFCLKIRELILDIKNSNNFSSNKARWEFLKYKIREFSINYSKILAKVRKQQELNIIYEINKCCNDSTLTELEKTKIISLQLELDNLYIKKAKGAYIRSKAKWIEEGEKSTSYFCRLEKRRQQNNSILSLLINGTECSDPTIIRENVFKFYSDLYSSNLSHSDLNEFFDKILPNIPRINNEWREGCEADLQIEELDSAVQKLKLNKSPGPDGLTANFYKFFWNDIRSLLFDAFRESIEDGSLGPSMNQGLITLIPKPDKDLKLIDNFRPITLLNSDYKIFTHAYVNRLKKGIHNLINESQSGFLKGRSIHNNIRLVMDLVEYCDLIEDDGFILFLDFKKAFDMIEHTFIFKSLELFGFGDKYVNIIKMIYGNMNSSVSLPSGTTHRFPIGRGIRQGCPLSPFLFILAVDMLATKIKFDNSVEKLNIFGKTIGISQLADDTTLFLKNKDQISPAISLISSFCKASGLQLNLNKCELLALHPSPDLSLFNIPVKETVKYLGILISKDSNINIKENFENKVHKANGILNCWLQRDISIFGRILLSKVEYLSKLIYPAQALAPSSAFIKTSNQKMYDFIWRHKTHYIKKSDIIKSYEEGGLNIIEFESMNTMLKLKWLQRFLSNTESFWYTVPCALFNKLGGIRFLLRCDFDLSKLPVKLSAFHQQVLLSWKLAHTHNFTPHNTPIWNNKYILHRNKSIFYEEWLNKNIWSVTDLMDGRGNILDYNTFTLRHGFACHPKQFFTVINAIPSGIKMLMKSYLSYSKITPVLPLLYTGEFEFDNKLCTNKHLRQIIIQSCFPYQVLRNRLFHSVDKNTVKYFRTTYLKFPILPKAKEVQFKILNDIYPSNRFLHLKFNLENSPCHLCKHFSEDTEHIFFSCSAVQSFWKKVQDWLIIKNVDAEGLTFTLQDVLYGITKDCSTLHDLINMIIVLAKYFIHKCRYFKTPPLLIVFKKELKIFSDALVKMKTKIALKMFNLFVVYNLP